MPVKYTEIAKIIGLQFFLPADKGIDWNMATAIAIETAQKDQIKSSDYTDLYLDIIDVLDPLIEDTTGYKRKKHIPLVYNRADWIITTVESVKTMFGQLIEEYWNIIQSQKDYPNLAKKTTKGIITSEIGLLIGYLSNKVLAQYDLLIPENQDAMLYFIEENIQARQKMLEVDGGIFRFWITMHELAHKYQFENNPWIKQYYFDLLDETKKIIHSPIKNRLPQKNMTLILTPSNWEIISKVQAFMSVIEGYADYVMHTAAKRLPDYESIAPVFERKKTGGLLKDIFEKILGFDLKINQYKTGYRFISSVAQMQGFQFIQENLKDRHSLPTLKEIAEPGLWVKRISS